MADKNSNYDWGDDPFEGDMNFDMDFDNPGKQGMLRSFATGFLGGIYDKTVGTTEGQIDTLKKVLPSSWTPAFRRVAELNQRRKTVMEELKASNFQATKDLQYLAARASKKLGELGANRIAAGLDRFGAMDVAGWEKKSYSTTDGIAGMESVEQEGVANFLKEADSNSVLQQQTALGVGETITNTMLGIGEKSLGQFRSTNQLLGRNNQLLEQIHDYQRKVQTRNDNMRLNILARMYLTNAKYYKFQEVSNHRIIAELRTIQVNSGKSDYEKTSHSQAARKSIRDSVFNTVKRSAGGIASFLTNRMGGQSRGAFARDFGEITSSFRMAAEMTEGMPINYAEMAGNAAAGIFLNNLPRLMKTNRAKELLAWFKKNYPSQAKWAQDTYKKFDDAGNIVNHGLGNMEGLANTLGKYYRGGTSFNEPDNYEDYVALLPAGKRVPTKAEWLLIYNAKKYGNKGGGYLFDNMTRTTGTQYSLTRRTLADSHENHYWSRRSDRTLNEEIPRWFAQIHLSIEKMRTGRDDLKAMSYDYTKANFISHAQRRSTVINQVFDKSQFSTQANMAKNLVNSIDTGGSLKEKDKQALAFQLAKDTDSKLGFSPYNYLRMEHEHGTDPATAERIRRLMKQQFGITDEHMETFFKTGTTVDQAMLIAKLPTPEARKKATDLMESAKSLGTFAPDITAKLDVLKSSGYMDTLKEAGIIKDENGVESVNMDMLWKTLLGFIKNPDKPATPTPANDADNPSRPFGGPGSPTDLNPTNGLIGLTNDWLEKIYNRLIKKTKPSPADEEKKKVGYASGGFTGHGGVNEYAGPAHKGEIIWSQEDIRRFGGVSRVESLRLGGPVAGGSYGAAGYEPPQESSALLDSLKTLKESIDKFGVKFNQSPQGLSDSTGFNKGFESVDSKLDQLILLATTRNETLSNLLTRQPQPSQGETEEDKKEQAEGRRSIIERLKNTNFRDFFNRGVDKLLDSQPLILGGLLGGLVGLAAYDPKAAGMLAVGATMAVGYGRFSRAVNARRAASTEDLYEEGSDTPVLESARLMNKDYLDLTTNLIIDSWDMIKGSVKVISTNAIIGGRRLAGKLFTADNKEVFLSGLNKIREGLIKAFKWFDPLNRMVSMKDKLANRFYQMDVYKENADAPTLIGKKFKQDAYFKRDGGGGLMVLTGWNEIDGPVWDEWGNVLITQEEYDMGLKTSMGVSINKMQNVTKALGRFGLDFLKKVKSKIMPAAGDAANAARNAFKADYTPIITSVDRIYHLLLKRWGMKDEDVPLPPPLDDDGNPIPPTPDEDGGADEETPESGDPTPENGKKKKKKKKTPGAPDATPPTPDGDAPPAADEGAPTPGKKKTKPNPVDDPDGDGRPTPKADFLEEAKEAIRRKLQSDTTDGRLNSLNDKKKKAENAKDNKVKDSIIRIGEFFGGGDKKDKPEKKAGSFGLFGMLASGLWTVTSFLGTFLTKTIWNGFGTTFRMAGMMLSIIPKIWTGISSIATGLGTLFRTGSMAAAGGAMLDFFRNRNRGPNDPPLPPVPPPTPGGRLSAGLKTAGLGLTVLAGTEMLKTTGIVEEGSTTSTVLDYAATGLGIASAYQLATAGLGYLGFNVGIGGVVAAVGTGISALAGWGGVALAAAAPLLFNPYTLAAIGITAAGYGLYKWFTRGEGTQLKLRLTQYGVGDFEGDLAEKIMKIEELLSEYVVIANGNASLSKDAPIAQVMKLLVADPNNQQEVGNAFTWLNGRIKPVFMTYMACLDVVKIKSLKDYDESTSQDVYKVAKQVHQSLGSIMPYPYSIVAKVSNDETLLPEKVTITRVNNLLEELKKFLDRKTPDKDLQGVATVKGQSQESLAKEKQALQQQLSNPNAFAKGKEGDIKRQAAKDRLSAVDQELMRLNNVYKAGSTLEQVYIKDLLPDGRAMDLLTAIRTACYGNDENVVWRVQAVLKLERYCEPLFTVSGDTVEFSGQIGDIYGLFKDAFRSEKKDADSWCLWFRDRFIPVMKTYVREIYKYRRGRPGVVWKTLSATARYEVARALIETKVPVWGGLSEQPVWKVRVSPFTGTVSLDNTDKALRMLKILGEASTVAKLRDPEAEAGRTNAQSWAKTVAPHKTGGDHTGRNPNLTTGDTAKNREQLGGAGQYSTNGKPSGINIGTGGIYNTPKNKYNYLPLGGESDTSHLDMSGVKANAGNDKGVSVPKKLALQLIIREMLKAGFSDPREVAEMLALSDYESGGFSRTTENMKYRDPAQMVKLFREVKNLDHARQLISQGEVAIANTVYGGGKGASLGNTQPGDGWRYRGRGFIQLTGRGNYIKTGRELGIDLENNPELASTDPNVMAKITANFFKNSKLLRSIKQTGDFGSAARGLNGGNELPGMPKRYQMYLSYLDQLNKGELKPQDAVPGEDSPPVVPASGSTGYGTPAANGTPSGTTATPPPGGGAAPSGMGGGGEPPMIGRNTPSMIPNGSGGAGATGNDSIVNSNSTGGLRLKSPEAIAGGESHPGTLKLAKIIQERVPNFRWISALNDAYHVDKGSKGAHPKGLAVDFSLTNGITGSDLATNMVIEILRQAGLTEKEFQVINEYRVSTALGTGGHVHAGFRSPEAAQKFLTATGGAGADKEVPVNGPTENPTPTSPAMPARPPSQQTGLPLPTVPPAPAANEPTTPKPDQQASNSGRNQTQLPLGNPLPEQKAPEGMNTRVAPKSEQGAGLGDKPSGNNAVVDAVNTLREALGQSDQNNSTLLDRLIKAVEKGNAGKGNGEQRVNLG